MPKLSIITVVYNSLDLLQHTAQSVWDQTYRDIEYLIIDGGSQDGTAEWLQQNDHRIDQWLSEPDQGLYDAMNKGLEMAEGEFVWFMNAGDHLFEETTVAKVFEQGKLETDVFYGEVMLVDEVRTHLGTRSKNTTRKLPPELDWKSLKYGMVVSHQGIIVRKSIAPKYGLNNLSADIDWVIEVLKNSRHNQATQLILAEYLIGGVSVKRHRAGLIGRFKILTQHYGLFAAIYSHFFMAARALLHYVKGGKNT